MELYFLQNRDTKKWVHYSGEGAYCLKEEKIGCCLFQYQNAVDFLEVNPALDMIQLKPSDNKQAN